MHHTRTHTVQVAVSSQAVIVELDGQYKPQRLSPDFRRVLDNMAAIRREKGLDEGSLRRQSHKQQATESAA